MKIWMQRRVRVAGALVGALVMMGASPAQAQISYQVLAMAVTNYTGFVIAADGPTNNASYNRESLLVDSDVRVGNSGAGAAAIGYYLSYRLLDGAGQAHPIFNGASGSRTNADYSYRITNNVVLPANSAFIDNDLASIRPAARLNPALTYTVELRLFTLAGAALGVVATDGPRPYSHFTNLLTDDPAVNVLATLDAVAPARIYAVSTDPDRNSFQVDVDYTLRRYDNFMGGALPLDSIAVWLTVELRDAGNNVVIPLQVPVTNFSVTMARYDPPPPSDPIAPRVLTLSRRVNVIPADGVQLDSVNRQYQIRVAIAHTEIPGVPPTVQPGNSVATAPLQLLHFNGHLRFGPVETVFSSIDNDPSPSAIVSGSHVVTQLGVDGNSGYVVGHPGYTYGDGTDLSVQLRSDGVAQLRSGQVPVALPTGTPEKLANVQMELLPPGLLTSSGLRAGVRVTLPTGFGYRFDTNGHFLQAQIDFSNVPINEQLVPTVDLTYAPTGGFFGAEETKPVWIECRGLTWRVGAGRFDLDLVGRVHYVRQDEYALLTAAAGVLENSDRDLKRSNERYFGAVNAIQSPAFVTAAADCTARLSVGLGLGAGAYRAHFPYDAAVAWTGAGTLRVVEDEISIGSGASQLTRVGPVSVPYDTACPGCEAGAQVRAMTLAPAGEVLTFTRDGGLVAAGALQPAHRLQWGWNQAEAEYAHESFTFDQGALHLPGVFLRGDQVKLEPYQRPLALVYTGVAATNLSRVERPDVSQTANAAAYEQGYADYAGINVAVGADGAKQGESLLGRTRTGSYDLKANSKYYARRGGVSGVHDATTGSFPDELLIYGYRFQFETFGFNLLDSQMRDSLVRGAVIVPYPSDFDQRFLRLRLDCQGGVEGGTIDPGDVENHLAYWNNTFQSRSLEFRSASGEVCDTSDRSLVLGVETKLSDLSDPLIGLLGFQPGGDLIARGDDIPDLDSRLKLPSVVRLAGPPHEEYRLHPVADAYFNGWTDHPVPVENLGLPNHGYGWVNVAGSMDVPFFEDLNVHLHLSGSQALARPPVYVMGGWPTDRQPANHGWEIGGENFFTAVYFDDANRGYAGGLDGPGSYRDSGSDEYLARAQRSWLRVIEFDYPLTWNPVLRRFQSRQPRENDFLVLTTEHQAKTLSAQTAELTLGAQFEFLPSVNLANLFFNALDDATGVASTLSSVLGAPAYGDVTNGLRWLDRLLAPQLIDLYRPVLDDRIDSRIAGLRTTLAAAYAQADTAEDFLVAATGGGGLVAQALEGAVDTVATRLIDLAGADPGAAGLMRQLTNGLGIAGSGIVGLNTLFSAEPDGSLAGGAQLVHGLISAFAPEYAANLVAGVVENLLAPSSSTLGSLGGDLTEVRDTLAGLRTTMGATDGMGSEIRQRLQRPAARAEVAQLTAEARSAVDGFLQGIHYGIDSPFSDYSTEEFVRFVRREIEDRYHGTTMTPAVQSILRQRLYDPEALLRQATDTGFQELNNVAREVLSETAEELGGAFTQWLGGLSGAGASAGIDGYAKINGDSLKELRLDVHAKLEVVRPMEFGAYLQIKELDSDGTPGCGHGHEAATEVTFGARTAGVKWFGSDADVSVDNKLTFGGGSLLGMAGAFNLEGNISFGTFTLEQLAAAAAFGVDENYLSGGGSMALSSKRIAGGLFVGRACSLDPIRLWDPVAASVLGGPSFSGFYGYGEIWISINELLGIPSSCLFDLSGGIGLGAGLFVEGPTAIGKIKYGVSGDLLCLLSVTGSITGAGSVNLGALTDSVTDSLSLTAVGDLTASLGYCPFCIPFHRSVSLTYQGGHWSFQH